jgi:hypothetical protein
MVAWPNGTIQQEHQKPIPKPYYQKLCIYAHTLLTVTREGGFVLEKKEIFEVCPSPSSFVGWYVCHFHEKFLVSSRVTRRGSQSKSPKM